jgi:hypothetical protein
MNRSSCVSSIWVQLLRKVVELKAGEGPVSLSERFFLFGTVFLATGRLETGRHASLPNAR